MKGSTRVAKVVLAGNDNLRTKGRRDQAIGQVKRAVKSVADKVAKRLGE